MEISVLITNYNYDRYVARSIRSALNQSFSHAEFEILVIDDCSNDNSRSIIESFGKQIRPIFNDKNMGLAASCNKAISLAMGKFVIRLDADDYLHHDCLKLHHLFLSHNKEEMDATSSDYYEVDDRENIIRRRSGTTYPIACGVMYKNDDLIQFKYDSSLPREDFEHRREFLKAGKHIYNIAIPLYRYTNHSDSLTKGL